jgi:hypothetical protein
VSRDLRVWLLLAAAFVFARFVTSWFVLGAIELKVEIFVSAAVVSAVQSAMLKFATRRQKAEVQE